MSEGYKGNSLLKKIGTDLTWTAFQIDELAKCAADPIYFVKTYLKVIDVDKGLIPIALRTYQEDMINNFHKSRRTIVTTCRRSGKSTAVCGYLLWYIIFNDDKTVALLANKGDTARELLNIIQIAYQNLPQWLQHGIIEFNKGSFVLENNSRVIAAATSSDAIRGYTIALLYIDECAFIENWPDFSRSVLPTITSGKETKIILVSTPNGMNFYYKIWDEALKGKNGYAHVMVHWKEVPGNDEKWYKETMELLNNDETAFNQEYNVEFLGSTHTLISGKKLKELVWLDPIGEDFKDEYGQVDIFEEPIRDHTYVMTVDVSRGQGLDAQAFSIIDVTQIPYKQVAKYKNNRMSPLTYPNVIDYMGKAFNNAYVLVEINDIGQQIVDILHYELSYENLIKLTMKGKQGQNVSGGYKKQIQFGVRTTTPVKRIGCSNLKALVENNKLIINDFDTINELTTFVSTKESFAAEEGHNDDLAMSLVLFGWLVNQRVFKETVNTDLRSVLQKEQMDLMEIDYLPPPIVSNGLEAVHFVDAAGDLWMAEDEWKKRNYYNDMYGSIWDPKL